MLCLVAHFKLAYLGFDVRGQVLYDLVGVGFEVAEQALHSLDVGVQSWFFFQS